MRYSFGVAMKPCWRIRGPGEIRRLQMIFLIMSSGRVRIVDLKVFDGTVFGGAT